MNQRDFTIEDVFNYADKILEYFKKVDEYNKDVLGLIQSGEPILCDINVHPLHIGEYPGFNPSTRKSEFNFNGTINFR